MTSNKDKEKIRPQKLFDKTKTIPWKESWRFVMLPRPMVADKQLSHGAVRLATILCSFDMSKRHLPKDAPPTRQSSRRDRSHYYGDTRRRDRRVNKYGTEGIVYPGNRTLAEAMGVSEPMVIKYKMELIGAGYLEERRRYSKTSLHVMKFPVVASIEDLVRKYSVFSIPLRAYDFKTTTEDLYDADFMAEIAHFFDVVEEVKDAFQPDFEENGGPKKHRFKEMEATALKWYNEDKAARDAQQN